MTEYVLLNEDQAFGAGKFLAMKLVELSEFMSTVSWSTRAMLARLLSLNCLYPDGLYFEHTFEFLDTGVGGDPEVEQALEELECTGWVKKSPKPGGGTYRKFNLGMFYRVYRLSEMFIITGDLPGEHWRLMLDEILIPAENDFDLKYRNLFCRMYLEHVGDEVKIYRSTDGEKDTDLINLSACLIA